ncbi:MAG: LLM class flavin-dependent oxidoreductase [Acidimicrobiia bacterium]|nr:LLM class flavin-dependent oxidoreductase [Acidimicrobiia bacterium]
MPYDRGMVVAIGAMVLRSVPPEQVVAQARELAPHVDEIWVVEDLPFAGGVSQAGSVLEATKDLPRPPLVGHGIAPAPFRNPAALAMEWATLARMHPGRFHGGIGHGVPEWMAQIGSNKASPLGLLAETITSTRALLRGQTVTVDGRYVHLDGISLQFPPDPPPMVSAGVAGPRSLAVAGRTADGTILSEGSGPADVETAWRHIETGRAEAQANGEAMVGPHRLTVFAGYYCGDLSVLPPRPEHLPPGWDAVGSEPAVVAALLQSLVDAGAESIVLVPFGPDVASQIELAATEIVPDLTR